MLVDAVRIDFQGHGLWLLNGVIALIMFGVALDLGVEDFKRVASSAKPVAVGLFAQYVVLPAATFLLILILRPLPSIALGMLLVAACPGGNLSNFLTHLAKGNTALSITMTAVSTLAAILLTPLTVTLWAYLHPATRAIMQTIRLDPLQMVLTVLVILAVPLVTGMAFNRRFPRTAARLQSPFKYGSIVFFIAFVGYLFARNYGVFVTNIHWVAVAVFLQNAMGLLAGYAVSRFMSLSSRDVRAITIEVGIRNSALGLVLVFAFFDGRGGMALVAAAWGIWHVIAGLTVASLWARRAPDLVAVEAPE
ncbi:MAG TPA: bile acid:sodium symporter family protein [Candidatus Hydrogenedentes bacterium]|nr:bile acid:sodium symporter family protein [Candidatus Hydrogenedentota bacterium]